MLGQNGDLDLRVLDKVEVEEAGIGLVQIDGEVLGINHRDILHPLLHVRGEGQFRRIAQLFQRELDIIGGEGRAVVPGHALANDNGDARKVLCDRVALGQPRDLRPIIMVVVVEKLEERLVEGTANATQTAERIGVEVCRLQNFGVAAIVDQRILAGDFRLATSRRRRGATTGACLGRWGCWRSWLPTSRQEHGRAAGAEAHQKRTSV